MPNTGAVNGVLTIDPTTIAIYNGAPTFTPASNQLVTATYVDDAITTGAGASALTGLSDVSSSTVTAGRLLVADGTNWESVDTMYVSPTGGNVGIGTDTPGYPLAVVGDVNIATGGLGVGFAETANGRIRSSEHIIAGNRPFAFYHHYIQPEERVVQNFIDSLSG